MEMPFFRLLSLIVLLSICVILLLAKINQDESANDVRDSNKHNVEKESLSQQIPDNKIYEQLLQMQRTEQRRAIKSVLAINDAKKQRMVLKDLLSKIKNVLLESRNLIDGNREFDPTRRHLPKEEHLKEAVSKVVENTVFFAEFVLHFPDFVAAKFYANDDGLRNVYKWAYEFSNTLAFYDHETMIMLSLAGQELLLIAREEDYVNPYAKEVKKKEDIEREAADLLRQQQEQKRAKKVVEMKMSKKNKGPGLSKSDL